MGLFRCEDIIRCQLYLPNDVAYHAVANLGEINAIEFIDVIFFALNDNFMTKMNCSWLGLCHI